MYVMNQIFKSLLENIRTFDLCTWRYNIDWNSRRGFVENLLFSEKLRKANKCELNFTVRVMTTISRKQNLKIISVIKYYYITFYLFFNIKDVILSTLL